MVYKFDVCRSLPNRSRLRLGKRGALVGATLVGLSTLVGISSLGGSDVSADEVSPASSRTLDSGVSVDTSGSGDSVSLDALGSGSSFEGSSADVPSEAPRVDVPTEKPADVVKVDAPVETPAEVPSVDVPKVDVSKADTPTETPSEVARVDAPAEKPADGVKVDSPTDTTAEKSTDSVKVEAPAEKPADAPRVDTPAGGDSSSSSDAVGKGSVGKFKDKAVDKSLSYGQSKTEFDNSNILTEHVDSFATRTALTVAQEGIVADTKENSGSNVDGFKSIQDLKGADVTKLVQVKSVDATNPEYSAEHDLYPNDVNMVLKPQDYLVVYDYYGMDEERRQKGWGIIKSLASSVADGSRFIFQMTKSQLDGHANITDGQVTTSLLDKSEVVGMSSPTDLVSKGISGSGTFYDKYQNELRGNSDHDISAMYIFDNWTTVTPQDPNSEKENYDQGFLSYLKSHDAKTIMAVGLFDKDGSAENLVVSQSKASGFDNYYISSNPDVDALVKQYLDTSKAYQTGSRSYVVTVNSQDGVKLSDGVFSVNGKDYPLVVSGDGLSATADFSYGGEGIPKGSLKYRVGSNTSDRDVTVTAKVSTSGKDAIDYGSKVIPHTSKGSVSVGIKANGVDLGNLQLASNVSYGSTYDITGIVPDKIEVDGSYYRLDSHDTLKGSVDSPSSVINLSYAPITSNMTVNFLDAQGNKLVDSMSKDYATNFSYKLPETVEKDGVVYHLGGGTRSNEFGDTLSSSVVDGNVVYNIHYYKDLGGVTLDYLDSEGHSLADTRVLVSSSVVGSDYKVDGSVLPNEITTKSGKVYRLSNGSELTSGKVSLGVKNLVAKYIEDKVNFSLEIGDRNGGIIFDKFSKEGLSKGTDYRVSDLVKDRVIGSDGKIYDLDKSSLSGVSLDGKLSADTSIRLVYDEVLGRLVLDSVAKDGTILKELVKSGTHLGSNFDTSSSVEDLIITKDGKHYRLDRSSLGNAKGVIDNLDKLVKVDYDEVKTSLTVRYTSNGREIKETYRLDDRSVGESYDVSGRIPDRIKVNGIGLFRLVSKDLAVKGTLVEEPTLINAEYEPVMTSGRLVFIDENGNSITSPIIVDGVQVDSNYDFSSYGVKSIVTADGREYDLVRVSDNVSGVASEDGFTVQFIYRERVKPVVERSSYVEPPRKEEPKGVPAPASVEPVRASSPVAEPYVSTVLPNTGDSKSGSAYVALGVMSSVIGLGMYKRKSRSEDSDL